jgi:signal transduction histidine kinase
LFARGFVAYTRNPSIEALSVIMGAFRKAPWMEGAVRLGPVGMRRLLDASSVLLALAMVGRLGDFEILLQALWVLVGIGAFLYGLRRAVLRMLLVAVVAIAYATLATSVGEPIEDEPFDSPDFAEWALMAAIAMIVAILADRIATSAARYASLYRQASERLVTAQEEERSRLARDLHDGVGQTLTAAVLALDAAQAGINATDRPSTTARQAIARAQSLAATALDETREVATRLRPTRIHEIGLGAAVRNLADSAGVEVEVRFDPALMPPGLLEPEREIDAYRIVQEAINNAARHSHASRVWVDGRVTEAEIRIEIGDDGQGFDSSAWQRGLGLAGMTERAAVLGARLEVRSLPGEGTTIELVIPTPHADGMGRSRGSIPAARAAQ